MNKVPVGKTIREAYGYTFGHLGRVIGLIWLPELLITLGAYFVAMPYYTSAAAAQQGGDPSQMGPQMLEMLAYDLVSVLFLAMIFAAIARDVLGTRRGPGFIYFSLTPAEFRVFGGFLGLGVLTFVFLTIYLAVAFGVRLALGGGLAHALGRPLPTDAAKGIAGLIVLAVAAIYVFVFTRLGFLLVPATVGEGKVGIERSWILTRGNFWRVFAIGLAVFVPVALVALVAEVAILGPQFFHPPLAADAAARAEITAAQMRQLVARMPEILGLSFLLAPFTYGLMASASAFAYRALTESHAPSDETLVPSA